MKIFDKSSTLDTDLWREYPGSPFALTGRRIEGYQLKLLTESAGSTPAPAVFDS